ncbi:hypothetical protein [Nitrosopumilus ureiphilus]|uniref:hypothetical protein n=1 Tax=Nitrosopumilus ureiphilus TaxID=1470067 RepID=UPI0015CAEB82|nr:hypothetical protein [Nitrosopumilus ureiphilus]
MGKDAKAIITLVLISVLISSSVSAFLQSADAVKGNGVSNTKYGQATKNLVCGDRLCSEPEPKQAEGGESDKCKSNSAEEILRQVTTGLVGAGAPPPYDVIGVALLEAAWPSGGDCATLTADDLAKQLHEVVITLEEFYIKHPYFVAVGTMNEDQQRYENRKNSGTYTNSSLHGILSGYLDDSRLFPDAIISLEDSTNNLDVKSLFNYFLSANMFFGIEQELALLSSNSTVSPNKTMDALDLKNPYVPNRIKHVWEVFPKVSPIRLTTISDVKSEPVNNCNADVCTKYYFDDTATNFHYEDIMGWDYPEHSAPKCTINCDAESNVNEHHSRYIEGVKQDVETSLRPYKNMAICWQDLLTNPVPQNASPSDSNCKPEPNSIVGIGTPPKGGVFVYYDNESYVRDAASNDFNSGILSRYTLTTSSNNKVTGQPYQPSDIVGIGTPPKGGVFVYYNDGYYSRDAASNDFNSGIYASYTLTTDYVNKVTGQPYQPSDIVGIGTPPKGGVFVYYNDGYYSRDAASNDFNSGIYASYTLTTDYVNKVTGQPYQPSDIVGIGTPPKGGVFVYYNDGYYSRDAASNDFNSGIYASYTLD